MKYYPLEAVDHMEATESPMVTLNMMKDKGLCDQDATIEDLHDYVYGLSFFSPNYEGKFKKWNNEIIHNRKINKMFFPMYSMKQIEERQTEWKDILSTNIVLSMWSKFKMVYKIDNDFFHEIKQTENIITSKETFDKLPFKCFFIDLTEVDNIANFKGAWVYITKDSIDDKELYGVNIYMAQNDNFTFFTYYSWYKFTDEEPEIEWHSEDLPKSDFIARTFVDLEDVCDEKISTKNMFKAINDPIDLTSDNIIDVTIDMRHEYDPRESIVVTIFQIMSFIAIDASDVRENATTKSTYKPHKEGSKIKNKFSEIRMWDVGIQYGKAIRVAKQEYKKHIERENGSIQTKDRKPVRPHIRRAHWHKYRVGEGRKETKTLWLAPVYVCGSGKEIPVTIREVKK
jgi:hypothetical protein